MTEKKEYRSAIRSRRFIRQAFMELLREKTLEKITVTDIVSRADINRSTFYAHYSDVRSLLEEIQNEIIAHSISLMKEMDFQNFLTSPVPFLHKMFEIANENRELYALLGKWALSNNQLENFKMLLVEKAMNLSEIPEEVRCQSNFAIRVNFFVGGIINVYQQYLLGTLEATDEQIIADIAELIKSSSHTILNM